MDPLEREVLGCPHCRAPFRTRGTGSIPFDLTPGYTSIAGAGECWTDGVAMPRAGDGSEPVPAPRPGHVVGRCPICQRYLWIRGALLLRTASPEPANAAMTSGTEPPSEGPLLEPSLSAASLHEAIRAGLAGDRGEECTLRVLAWQADNDPLRCEPYWPHLPSSTAFPWWGVFLYPLLAAIFLWLLAKYALERRVLHRRWQRRLGGKTAGAADFVQNVQALAALLDSNLAHERLLLAEIARQQSQFDRALELLRPPFPAELRRAADRIQQLALQQDPMLRTLGE